MNIIYLNKYNLFITDLNKMQMVEESCHVFNFFTEQYKQ